MKQLAEFSSIFDEVAFIKDLLVAHNGAAFFSFDPLLDKMIDASFDPHTAVYIFAGCNMSDRRAPQTHATTMFLTRTRSVKNVPCYFWQNVAAQNPVQTHVAAKIDYAGVQPIAQFSKASVPMTYFTASSIELLMRDPYAFFARYVLKIIPNNDNFAQKKGVLFHEILASQSLEGKDIMPYWKYQAERMLSALSFDNIAFKEKKFVASLDHFTIEARADRIDQLDDGTYAIIDYKTGAPPSLKDIEAGVSPQLPILAYVAQKSANMNVSKLRYCHVKGYGKRPVEFVDVPIDIVPTVMEKVRERLHDLSGPFIATDDINDYAHLKRLC